MNKNLPTRIVVNKREFHCVLDLTMAYIGGKWKSIILWYLREDKKRFGELRKLIPDITERMLTLQLRELEKDGLVERKVFAEVPPKVEYKLTGLGNSIIPVVEEMAKWGKLIAGLEARGKIPCKEAKKRKKQPSI